MGKGRLSVGALRGIDNFLSRIGEVIGGDNGETGFLNEFFALIDIRALQPDHERHRQLHGFHGIDDAGGDDVAFHDAAENIHQDGFHIAVGHEDLKGFRDLFLRGAAADIEEVGWVAAMIFDDIHGGHREAGAVYETGDVAVEPDVIEMMFGRLDFARIFFFQIAHLDDVGMAEQGVIVKIEFGIEREHSAILGHDERIDFDHRAVALHEKVEEAAEQRAELFELIANESEAGCHFSALKGLKSKQGMDRFTKDTVRRFLRHSFDFDTAFGAGDDDRSSGGAVHEDGEVIFFLDIDRFSDEDLTDDFAIGTGLVSDEGFAQHFAGVFLGFLIALAELDAALKAIGKGAFAAAAGVDLGFHHQIAAAQFLSDLSCFGGGCGDAAFGGRDAEGFEKCFGLIFVDIHAGKGREMAAPNVQQIKPREASLKPSRAKPSRSKTAREEPSQSSLLPRSVLSIRSRLHGNDPFIVKT